MKSKYTPKPIETSDVAVPEDLREAAERLAEHVHDTWAVRRMDEGWRFGASRDDTKKTHPDLVPYDALPDSEKEYDRASALETIKALLKMGYRIER
jgi:ryanodine receptor 2